MTGYDAPELNVEPAISIVPIALEVGRNPLTRTGSSWPVRWPGVTVPPLLLVAASPLETVSAEFNCLPTREPEPPMELENARPGDDALVGDASTDPTLRDGIEIAPGNLKLNLLSPLRGSPPTGPSPALTSPRPKPVATASLARFNALTQLSISVRVAA